MALINWDDGLSVKVAIIDHQHKQLIALINELSDAMKQGKGKDVIEKTVNGLIKYTASHFKHEERYFEQFGYTDKDRHIKEHAGFVEKVVEFKAGLDSGKFSLSVEVIKFLSDWIQNHIKSSDKKYSEFFNEKGLK